MTGKWRIAAGLGMVLAIAGCAHRKKPPAEPPAPPPAPATAPVPPRGAAPGLPIPVPVDGRFTTINSDVGAVEAVWHVRAALNVAALSCRGEAAILPAYNALLTGRKAELATAYKAEKAGWPGTKIDQHMTRLYNFFAQPPAQPGFCQAAATEAAAIGAIPADGLAGYAPAALARLEAPILAFYKAYDDYRVALAAWNAQPHPQAMTAMRAAAPAAPDPVAAPAPIAPVAAWRIQIGAFTGEKAAEAAWTKAREAVPTLAQYEVHFEKAPGTRLIRVRLGPPRDRAGALELCAAAAAGGFDCLPVK
jgi:cell division septation protein DedD